MRPDLLNAQAAVDWAVAQFPTLENRIFDWLESCEYPTYKEFDPQRGKNAIKVRVDSSIPPIINAEVGAIVNSIRSSLDLLANALAERNNHPDSKGTSFPISTDKAKFLNDGLKKIKLLSDCDREIIKGLKPYKGGNDPLYYLHQMDIMRKHRRLIDVRADIGSWSLSGVELQAEFPDGWPRLENDTVLAWISIDAPNYELELSPDITLVQSPSLTLRPVLKALQDFAGRAESIIKLFA